MVSELNRNRESKVADPAFYFFLCIFLPILLLEWNTHRISYASAEKNAEILLTFPPAAYNTDEKFGSLISDRFTEPSLLLYRQPCIFTESTLCFMSASYCQKLGRRMWSTSLSDKRKGNEELWCGGRATRCARILIGC